MNQKDRAAADSRQGRPSDADNQPQRSSTPVGAKPVHNQPDDQPPGDLPPGDQPSEDHAPHVRHRPASAHDRYFRYVFSQPQPMRDLVLNAVAPELGSTGMSDPVVSVQPSGESFVDPELSEHRTDLLVVLRTASGVELGVYLLFEHKSRSDPHTIFQLMRYHAAVLGHLAERGRDHADRDQRRPSMQSQSQTTRRPQQQSPRQQPSQQPRRPPAIITVVVYNGPRRWTAATELSTALGLGAAAAARLKDFAHFRYLVFDVAAGTGDNYVGGSVSRTALQALHAASRKLGKGAVVQLARLLTRSDLPEQFRVTTLRYLQDARDDNTKELLAAINKQGYTIVGETMITWAEARRQEGVDIGVKQGLEQGLERGVKQGQSAALVQTLIRLMDRKFQISAADRLLIRASSDIEKLQAALDEIIEPGASRESVLQRLQ